VRLSGEKVRSGEGDVVFEGRAAEERDRVTIIYRDAGVTPPLLDEVMAGGDDELAAEVVGALIDQGELEKVTPDILFHRDAFERARRALEEIQNRDGNITVGAFRDDLGISRKYAVPLLEHFDALRVTRRDGDVRVLR
jgi:selenocysteine-specific elongation factor